MQNKFYKRFILLLLVLLSGFTFKMIKAAESNTTHVYIHYFRFDHTYDPWDLWIWQYEPNSLEGSGYAFEKDETDEAYNFGGVVSKVELSGTLEGATKIGFIVRKPDWSKDIDQDRHISISSTSEAGIQHIYLVENDPSVGYAIDDPNGPSKSPKFKQAYFRKPNEIYFLATEDIVESKLTLLKDNIPVVPKDIRVTNDWGVITLLDSVDFNASYKLTHTFSDESVGEIDILFDGIYDSAEFESAFHYTGNDLGAHATGSKTTFRLWAPISSAVMLNLYDTGTPLRYGGKDEPIRRIPMVKSLNGTFYYEEAQNLHNTYYTYSVTNGNVTNEVVDPYAYSTGINGIRGLVVDFSKVNPEGFQYHNRPDNVKSNVDAIIYELHVRDLTMHQSWNGNNNYRGKFLGLIEKGTTYQGIKTGFDHILDLGVTHVQLLPFYDYGVVDETKLSDQNYNSFNWGYMPLHFNTPEGSFSTDPYDGITRINELKQVTTAFTLNNLRLNMDVVYNHTGLSADSNFNLIIPGYYHRKTSSGAFSNGSGTGNETASERVMMRKFMVDSVLHWAKEYNISGFRFDLMALHDIQTMIDINNALLELDPTIMVYGEPWMGGSSPLPQALQAGKANLDQLGSVGAFNDDFRDAVKGSVFNSEAPGFVNGDYDAAIRNRLRYGILGGVEHDRLNLNGLSSSKAWHGEPYKTINYVTAHDNNTLHDKLYMTNEITDKLDKIDEMVMQAYAILMTSQGVAFMHAGDEFLRSKPKENGKGFDHNSYESPDSVNQMRWDELVKEDNQKVYHYIKALIQLRKENEAFRKKTSADIKDSITFGYEAFRHVLAYKIDDQFLVIHNAGDKTVKLALPHSHSFGFVDALTQKTYKSGQGIKLGAHESLILEYSGGSSESGFKMSMNKLSGYTTFDSEKPQPNRIPLITGVTLGIIIVIGASVVFILKKRKKA